MREELGESFVHLRSAAAHAAGGTAAATRTVTPKLRNASGMTVATVAPIAGVARRTARSGARQAERAARNGKARMTGKKPRATRWPMMLSGLLAAGAALGAAGAMVARRRANRGQWEEYGTAQPTTTVSGSAPESAPESALSSSKAGMATGTEKVQSLAESAKERAADLMGDPPSTSANAKNRP
jgi:hypothetical protein